ncbi:MAG TPA: TonB-dependent receptor [Puia sp.]|nr:TonB-dependent receptor [Puia sp.]
MRLLLPVFALLLGGAVRAQTVGHVHSGAKAIDHATVRVLNTDIEVITDSTGAFVVPVTGYPLYVSAPGYASVITTATDVDLKPSVIELDQVVVIANKREQDARELPLSITTLNAADVQAARLWAAEDLRTLVPNLYAANPGDGRNAITIRGITGATSYDPAVTTYIDGVGAMTLDTYIPNLFDIDRIEVLKGPQGTLYGRNAMGGVINIVTRPPSPYARGFAEASFGNYGLQRYTAGVSTPVIPNKLYLSAAMLYEGRNGYYTNDYNHSNFDAQHRFGGTYALRWLINPKWSVEANFKHLENRNHGAFTLDATPALALAAPYHVDQNATTLMVDNTVNASLVAKYAGRGLTFSTQTAYASNYRYYQQPIDGDFSPADAVSIVNNYGKPWNKVQDLSEELRLGNAGGGPWTWTTGVYGFYRDVPNKQGTHFGRDAALVGSPDTNYTILNTSNEYGAGLAVYGQATRAFTHGWSLTAGLRYDYEHNYERVNGMYVPDGGTGFVMQPDTSAGASYGAFSPMAALGKRIGRTNIYARYARGYRTGGLTAISGDPTQPPLYPYKPEYSSNWELGAKGSFWKQRVSVDAAVFYCLMNDVQVPTLELPAGVTVIRNAGRLTSRGFDGDVSALLARGLQLTYNIGVTHATFDRLDLSENGAAVDLKGKRQVFTPDMTSTAILRYTVTVNTVSFHGRFEWAYLGRQYFDLGNTVEQSSYQLVNAGVGVGYKDFTLDGWTRNLTHTRYIAYAYDFGAARLGDPCTYGVTLRWAGRAPNRRNPKPAYGYY